MDKQQKEIMKMAWSGLGSTIIFQLFAIYSGIFDGFQNYYWWPIIISISFSCLLLLIAWFFSVDFRRVVLIQMFYILEFLPMLIPIWYAGWLFSVNLQNVWIIVGSGIIGTLLSFIYGYSSGRKKFFISYPQRLKSRKIDIKNGFCDLIKDPEILKMEKESVQERQKWLFPLLPALGAFISRVFGNNNHDIDIFFVGLCLFVGCLTIYVMGEYVSTFVEVWILEKKIGKHLNISIN